MGARPRTPVRRCWCDVRSHGIGRAEGYRAWAKEQAVAPPVGDCFRLAIETVAGGELAGASRATAPTRARRGSATGSASAVTGMTASEFAERYPFDAW
jgi:hypothetical protein